MNNNVFYVIVAIIILDFLLERMLDYLNARRWTREVPERLTGIYDPEKKNGPVILNWSDDLISFDQSLFL